MAAQPDPPPLGVETLVRFLTGDAEATLALARARGTLLLGAVFVLAAGIAREYDGEDLVHEPWHALIPLGASLVPSFLLAFLAWLALLRRAERAPRFRDFYGEVLSVFWMTAPIAWLYAFRWDRFAPGLGEAAWCKLATLGLVASWRVLLAMRFVRVLTGARGLGPQIFVILVSTGLVALALSFLPANVFAIMGGIRQTAAERVVAGPALLAMMWTVFTGWFWVLAAIGVLIVREPPWSPPASTTSPRAIGRGLRLLAAGAVVFFSTLLPLTQPAQIRRHQVEALAKAGKLEDAVRELSAHARGDYPRFWEPPVRYGNDLFPMLRAAMRPGTSAWVRRIYVERQKEEMSWMTLRGRDLAEFVDTLEGIPEGPEIAASLEHFLSVPVTASDTESNQQLERLRALASKAPQEK